MAFLRFIVSARHPDSGVEDGLFRLAYGLQNDLRVSGENRQTLKRQLEWFERHLQIPSRFNRSTSKGYYRRDTRGIAWFRDTAKECLARMHEVKRVLEDEGFSVRIVREDRIGYVVYEDDLQVVAEPFSDTRTG